MKNISQCMPIYTPGWLISQAGNFAILKEELGLRNGLFTPISPDPFILSVSIGKGTSSAWVLLPPQRPGRHSRAGEQGLNYDVVSDSSIPALLVGQHKYNLSLPQGRM